MNSVRTEGDSAMNDTKANRDRAARADKPQTKAEQAAKPGEAERHVGGEELQAENARLKEALRREHEIHLRSLADFDNFRRRVERDRASMAQAGKREMVLSLLDVLDDFDRALENVDDAASSVTAGHVAFHQSHAWL